MGFGSYDFMRQGTGCICCYSLKNTKFPEYIFNTDSGVCALDWHPSRPALLAVGLYDGTVLVYDVRGRTRKPIYASTIRTNKHTDPGGHTFLFLIRSRESTFGSYSDSVDEGRISSIARGHICRVYSVTADQNPEPRIPV